MSGTHLGAREEVERVQKAAVAEEGAHDLLVRGERGEKAHEQLRVRRRAAQQRKQVEEGVDVVAERLDALGRIARRCCHLEAENERRGCGRRSE